MAKVRGKDVEFELDSNDLSTHINDVSFEQSTDSEDVTTLGNDSHRRSGVLNDGSITLQGWYDDDVAGPRAVIAPLLGTVVAFIYRPEGTGSGLPEITGSVLVQNYAETSPVAGHVTWAASLERDGDWTETAQV